jgi:antitoxin component of MazEF toxin-antitoxin module
VKSQVSQWGNSLAIKIPPHIVKSLDLRADDAIEFSLIDGKAILAPVRSLPKFASESALDELTLDELTLDELLEATIEPPEPEVDWGKPVGQEVW